MRMTAKLPGALAVIALCAFPALGADPAPTPIEIDTLTRIDSLPTRDEVVIATGTVGRLRTLAMTSSVDFGLQLRAIRALAHFCTPDCRPDPTTAQTHPAHAVVLEVIASVGSDRSGRGILRLRAGIEALGLIRSGMDSDVELLIAFLNDASRDIRASTARALRDTCSPLAIVPLRTRYNAEPATQLQVRLAISAALRDLNQCAVAH